MKAEPSKEIQTVVLSPTRELAMQVAEELNHLAQFTNIQALLFTAVKIWNAAAPPAEKPADHRRTPGRLIDHMKRGTIDLSHITTIVLDEADEMLDMGFIHDVRRVLKLLPAVKQTLFFSATMPPEVMDLVNGLLKKPVKVAVDPVSSPLKSSDQSVYLVDKGNKSKLLVQLLEEKHISSALVFTRTKHGANRWPRT